MIFFTLTFSLISLCLYAQNFEGQIVQVCNGTSANTIFATAEEAPSGSWELYNSTNTTTLGVADNGEYLESSNFTIGDILQIRDIGNSTIASLSNIGGESNFTTMEPAFSSMDCDDQLYCSSDSKLDLNDNGLKSGFSSSAVDRMIGSNTLNGTHSGSFNAVIFGNFTSDGSGDSEGRLAIEEDFTVPGTNYSIGVAGGGTGGLHAPIGWDNLIIGQNVDFSGNIRGNVLYNTATTLPSFIGFSTGSSSGMYRQYETDIDWTEAKSYLSLLSDQLNPSNIAIPHTLGTIDASSDPNIILDANNEDGAVVFNLPSFNTGDSFAFKNFSNADAIIINVAGNTIDIDGGAIYLQDFMESNKVNFPVEGGKKDLVEKTLWNFYETTSFSLSGYLLTGSVLAPFTTNVALNGGNINGQSVFSGNVNQSSGFEFHNFCFKGSDYLPEQFTLTIGSCWRTLSSPIENLQYDELLDDLWTQGISGADYTGGEPNIFVMNSTGDDWTPLGNLDQPITAGTGFLMSVFTDDEYGTTGSWDKTISVGGTENPAPVTVTSDNMATDGYGFTLLGNPYKRPIDFDGLSRTDVDDAVWVYNRNASGTTNGSQGSWMSWSGGVGDLTDGIIAPFQGFLVRNVEFPSNSSVTFPESSKTTGGEFYGKQKPQNFVRLEVQGESLYNSMWIRFSTEGSFDESQGDAIQLLPFEENYATLSTRKTNDELMDIGHFPVPNTDEKYSIPVNTTITKGGTYTLTATDVNLPNGVELILQDLETGLSIPITKKFEYSFAVGKSEKKAMDNNSLAACSMFPQQAKSNSHDRFLIIASSQNIQEELPTEVSLLQNYPNPFNPTTQITYKLPESGNVRLEIFDMIGRRVALLVDETVEAGTHIVQFNGINLSSGIYLYSLQTSESILTRKFTLVK